MCMRMLGAWAAAQQAAHVHVHVHVHAHAHVGRVGCCTALCPHACLVLYTPRAWGAHAHTEVCVCSNAHLLWFKVCVILWKGEQSLSRKGAEPIPEDH